MAGLALVSNQSGKVRRETFSGREYLIAPVVAIRAGVLNGELVPAEEIAAYVEAWNGIPLPLGHPTHRGTPVSANTPEIEAQSVGRFWHAQMDGDRLRGEVWIDVAKAQALGGDALEVLKRLEGDQPIEVSTAYWRDVEVEPGTFNGERYAGIAHNLRPDHLALLLHEIGACSWKDGCGVPRVNSMEVQTNQLTGQHTGVMVALYPPETAAAALAVDGAALPEGSSALPVNEIHLTLAYLGDLNEGNVAINQGDLLRQVMNFAQNSPIVRGMVSGVGRFTTTDEEGNQALFALYNCDYLVPWRYWLADILPVRGHGPNSYIPHITLAYLPAAAPMPNVLPQPQEIVFDRIGVAWGNQVTLFPLQGEDRSVSVEANNQHGFNPFTALRSAFRGLASALGFPVSGKEEGEPPTIEPVNNVTKEVPMDKDELVEKLAANTRHPFTREDLEAMSPEALQRLNAAVECGCGAQQPAENAEQETPAKQPEAAPEAAAAEVPVEEPVANAQQTLQPVVELPAELQALSEMVQELGGVDALKAAVTTLRSNQDQHRAELVNELKANERCAFDETDLQAMSLDQLEKLAASLKPASYAGRGGPRGNAKSEPHQVPAPPAIVLAAPDK